MIRCKLCGKSLYQNMNYRQLFQKRALCHSSCLEKLKMNEEASVIPIDYNLLYYDFVLEEKVVHFDELYLELFYLGISITRHLKLASESLLLYLDEEVQNFIDNLYPDLVFMLSKKPIILVSLWEASLSIFEK